MTCCYFVTLNILYLYNNIINYYIYKKLKLNITKRRRKNYDINERSVILYKIIYKYNIIYIFLYIFYY